MNRDFLQGYFEFAHILEALKKLERYKDQVYWRDYPKQARYESVADHTWRLCVLIMLFEHRLATKLDLSKALTMALIHDVPEIYAGDASPMGSSGTGQDSHAFNTVLAKERHAKEIAAAKKLFRVLPAAE